MGLPNAECLQTKQEDSEKMSTIIGEFFQEIGQMALDEAEGLAGKLLLHTEVELRELSADIFYLDQTGVVRYKYGSTQMQNLIYAFWTQWQKQEPPSNTEWRVMSYVIEDGEFSVDFIYSDQINHDEGYLDRRRRAIEHYFNISDLKVDYSRPE